MTNDPAGAFRSAIPSAQHAVCSCDGRRTFIGTSKKGEEVVLAWEFAGASPRQRQ
jgi:hypothetical protein